MKLGGRHFKWHMFHGIPCWWMCTPVNVVSLVQVMKYRMFRIILFPEPVLTHYQWDSQKQTSVRFQLKRKDIHTISCMSKCHMQYVGFMFSKQVSHVQQTFEVGSVDFITLMRLGAQSKFNYAYVTPLVLIIWRDVFGIIKPSVDELFKSAQM